MRIAFAGTPQAAVPTLNALVAAGHEIAVVLTREDAPLGRKRVLTPSPVAQRAQELGLTVLRANRVTPEVAAQLLSYEFELGVVVAYGAILRSPLLDMPRYGWINLHFSQLPRWRGAAPVQRAIMAGDTHSGIAVFQLESGLDTGPWYVNRPEPIGVHETAGQLLARLADIGASDVVETVSVIAAGGAQPSPQCGEITIAAKLRSADGHIDWGCTAAQIDARVRGVTPDPGAVTVCAGQRIKVLRGAVADVVQGSAVPGIVQQVDGHIVVATGEGSYELLEMQPAGKTRMAAADWWRGQRGGEVRFG